MISNEILTQGVPTWGGRGIVRSRLLLPLFLYCFLSLAVVSAVSAEVLVEYGSPMKYLENSADPLLGTTWTDGTFNDTAWTAGTYGVGYETESGAENLFQTTVPPGAYSVYTRASFNIPDVNAVTNLFLGADYDDGYTAWINGVEVYRSPEMPAGAPDWNTNVSRKHESSNGAVPDYDPLHDITTVGKPALQDGTNVLAIGVWNLDAPGSSDLVLVPRLSTNESLTVTRGPYLQRGSDTEVIVRWRTSSATDSRVSYGSAVGSLTTNVDDSTLTTEHRVVLSGLSADTQYYYSIGTTTQTLAGDDATHFFITSPITGTVKPTRVWILGDSGTADANAAAVRDSYYASTGAIHTDLWLMLGDNAYPDGTDANYQDAVFDTYPDMLRKSVLWPTRGNNDRTVPDYFDIFSLPRFGEAGGTPSGSESYYSFDYGNIHFICLDSFGTDRSATGAMMTWLEQDLLDTTQEWIIAFWHHSPYSKGKWDSDVHTELIDMRENALPILEDYGVDLVFSGHSHSYERSFLIDGHYGLSTSF
ncbi:MAG: metallophosphoesterase family protein, partial [bacterium]|nr:metallophosphoesterase family protein [bacterium]